MLENISVLCHSCIKLSMDKIIYVDPYGLDKNMNDADIILITHSHFDHLSENDIEKVRKKETIILAPKDSHSKLLKLDFKEENIIIVEPNCKYKTANIKIETIPAYNTYKSFHPKENDWVRILTKGEYLLYCRRYRYQCR